MGSLLTAIGTLAILMYLCTKLVTLAKKQEVDIMSASMEGSLDYRERLTADDGFFVAAALTEYDSNTEVIEDPRYGELIIEHYGWGYEQLIGSQSRTLQSHPCSDVELGFNRTD